MLTSVLPLLESSSCSSKGEYHICRAEGETLVAAIISLVFPSFWTTRYIPADKTARVAMTAGRTRRRWETT